MAAKKEELSKMSSTSTFCFLLLSFPFFHEIPPSAELALSDLVSGYFQIEAKRQRSVGAPSLDVPSFRIDSIPNDFHLKNERTREAEKEEGTETKG